MTALQSLRDGHLDEALRQLQEEIRAAPEDPKKRIFLFQLLAVMGRWDRALTQLNVVRDLDAAALPMVQTYQQTLNCEALRAKIFAGSSSPLVFGEPEPWIALVIEALRLMAQDHQAQAESLRAQAFEAAPTTAGSVFTHASADEESDDETGESFTWIADADPRLGPLLEAIVNGKYYWIPFHRIRQIDVEKPADLRDMVWMPAHFVWVNGGETVGMIPTRYPGSETSSDDLIRLARKTDWIELPDGQPCGVGQRMLATDQGEYPLMDVSRIVLDESSAAAS